MIRTYELSHESKTPLYVQLYEAIRADILSGSLPGGEKLPSKRAPLPAAACAPQNSPSARVR